MHTSCITMKHRRKPPCPSKPGIAHQHLLDNFDPIPDNHHELKNGHVLLLFVQNDKSPANTICALIPLLSASQGLTQNFKNLQHSHKRLKKSNKQKRKMKMAAFVSKAQCEKMKMKLDEKDSLNKQYENEIEELKEQLEDITKNEDDVTETKLDKKTYSPNIRLMVYDSIIHQVPTANILLCCILLLRAVTLK